MEFCFYFKLIAALKNMESFIQNNLLTNLRQVRCLVNVAVNSVYTRQIISARLHLENDGSDTVKYPSSHSG